MILGCGVDLIEVGRIEREMSRRAGDPFDDVFSPAELGWCGARPRPAEAMAVGFAAKEACVKALGTGLIGRMGWRDIEIVWPGQPRTSHGEVSEAGSAAGDSPPADVRPPGTPPAVILRGEAAAVAAAMGVTRVHLAVTVCRPARTSPGDVSERSRLKPASTNEGAGHSREPASAGSKTGAMAAAWVVLTGESESGAWGLEARG